jgi:hypothetical protein
MPVFPSPSYHGYDVTDYRTINRDYGSLADLRTLVAGAHARGMGVILDLPVNHTSDEDPWFVASRTGKGSRADWYVWSDQPQGSGWVADGDRYYYAHFGADLPDLNLASPAVTAGYPGRRVLARRRRRRRLPAGCREVPDRGRRRPRTPRRPMPGGGPSGRRSMQRPDALFLGEVGPAEGQRELRSR